MKTTFQFIRASLVAFFLVSIVASTSASSKTNHSPFNFVGDCYDYAVGYAETLGLFIKLDEYRTPTDAEYNDLFQMGLSSCERRRANF